MVTIQKIFIYILLCKNMTIKGMSKSNHIISIKIIRYRPVSSQEKFFSERENSPLKYFWPQNKNLTSEKFVLNRYRQKCSKVNTIIFDSALSHTRRSDALVYSVVALCSLLNKLLVDKFRVFACIGLK